MDIIKKDLFCTHCSFTFGIDYVYNTHMKLVHKIGIEANLTETQNESTESGCQLQPVSSINEKFVSNEIENKLFKCEVCQKNFCLQKELKFSYFISS